MNNISEQISLTEAMSEARTTELPAEWTDKSKIWVQALVKVQKVNTKVNWALAYNDGTGKPSIYKDFGSSAMVAKVLEIRPFSYLQEHYIPDLRCKKDILNYLSVFGEDPIRIENLLSTKKENGDEKSDVERQNDRALVKKLVVSHAIQSKINESIERANSRRIINESKTEDTGEDNRDYVTNPEQ